MGIVEVWGQNWIVRGRPVGPNVAFGATKRSKIVATRHVSWAENIPKMLRGRGSAPDPVVGAYSSPQIRSQIWGSLRGREGKQGKGEG